ncbi:MAG TPA: sigma factor-like helix-turn-helix DNA-binding protein [Terriglobales bacterium]|nr:sigma factor-like helix-turn-helix DNA-binding protein [Terriglobales bacterium]
MSKALSAQYLGRADEFQRLVMHAFSLRSVLRKVFLLCEVRGFTTEEAARILGISPRAATVRLERARREVNARMAIG